MKPTLAGTLHLWALRDVLRRPVESLLFAAALTLTIATVGTVLLLPRALYDTVNHLLDATPAIVVRRVDAAGWQPMPVRAAMAAADGIVGVVAARPRVWATVTGPEGPLTVVGVRPEDLARLSNGRLTVPLNRGQALVGSRVALDGLPEALPLAGVTRQTVQVIGRLPAETDIFSHDLVLLHMADARRLIGVPEGYASDLAVDVFHEHEQDAILPDLASAFPWPVRCTTRRQSAGVYANRLNRSGAMGAVAVIPSVLAVCLLVAVHLRRSMGRQTELGIMKAVGWTTADIFRLQLYRALAVCLPSAAMGVCLSFLMVYWPGVTWVGQVFLGWDALPPKLYLVSEGAVTVLLEVAGVILAPVVAAALAPAIKGATADVHDLMEGTGSQ